MISLKEIQETANFLKTKGFNLPKTGIILGTGLNDLLNYIESKEIISYADIPNFPTATVEFHKGQFVFGLLGTTPVVVMQGRFHYYEGYSMQQITFPVRVMKELGVDYLIVTNAAGGLNPAFKKGDLIITEDHINLLPDNPLRGMGSEFGNRFVDMLAPYSERMQTLLKQAFEKEGVPPQKGVYVAVMGPNLETRAEYRWLRNTGADMVGMSTVPEVIVANQAAMACAAISVITDECDPDALQPVNIAEIIETAHQADKKLSKIITNVVQELFT